MAVGGTVVGVGVSVTSGVGVTVGVSVGVGVGVSTGVGVCVDVGVKVGFGVLVGVDVAVGDPMNDVREQPRALIMTSVITSVEVIVAASFLPVILKSTDPLSPRKPCSWLYDKPKRELEDLPPLERIRLARAPMIFAVRKRECVVGQSLVTEEDESVLPFQRGSSP